MAGSKHAELLVQKLIETGLADRPGKLLYSSLQTLCPGDLYLLGYNPGGEPDHETAPILSHVKSGESDHRNEYLDASWETRVYRYAAGMAPLQRRVSYLLTSLRYDVRSVCASNLIFVRSKNSQLLETATGLARQCWPVHEFILGIVQPRCILVFGKEVWDFIQARAQLLSPVETTYAGHGNWMCLCSHISLSGRRTNLIALPHLSRYAIDAHPDVVEWVRNNVRAEG